MYKMGNLRCTKWGKNRVYDVQNGEFMMYKMGKKYRSFCNEFFI